MRPALVNGMTTFFEGAAGTGKTTALITAVRERVAERALAEHEAVLALTFMHGSRRRLASRLDDAPELRGRNECSTIDSFAWRTVVRWRSLAHALGFPHETIKETDYDNTCGVAAQLVEQDEVASWIRRSFPILVVDEMQDCRDQRLRLLQALTQAVESFVAADDFQDLNGKGEGPAVTWLRGNSVVVPLTVNHRTDNKALLDAAAAVRAGESVLSNGQFRAFDAFNQNHAASSVACNLVWYWKEHPVVLSPNRPATSTFVRQTCERLAAKPLTPKPLKRRPVGPFNIVWEEDARRLKDALLAALGLPEQGGDPLTAAVIGDEQPALRFVGRRMAHYCRLYHVDAVPADVVRQYVEQSVQSTRAHARQQQANHGVRAMTIHQAKNREFESVIVLWPYEVGGSEERQRRLLYNSITRAKSRVTILVQSPSPKNRRSLQPPFSIETS